MKVTSQSYCENHYYDEVSGVVLRTFTHLVLFCIITVKSKNSFYFAEIH